MFCEFRPWRKKNVGKIDLRSSWGVLLTFFSSLALFYTLLIPSSFATQLQLLNTWVGILHNETKTVIFLFVLGHKAPFKINSIVTNAKLCSKSLYFGVLLSFRSSPSSSLFQIEVSIKTQISCITMPPVTNTSSR